MSAIEWLTQWYKNNCDEDWEHCYGIRIQTIDNPGWMIDIDLADTNLDGKSFEKMQQYINDSDWINCDVENSIFRGRGSIDKLEKILLIFKKWAEEIR